MMSARGFVVFVAVVAMSVPVFGTHTHRMAHAIEHHSTLVDAPHHVDHGRTANWLLFGARDCGPMYAREISAQLVAGAVTVGRHKSGACVLVSDRAVSDDELAAVLMSERRGGRLDGFHRERVAAWVSH